MNRVAIYARVSTEREEQKNSLENQVFFARDLIVKNGWTEAGLYMDEGISGTTIAKRKGIQRLLEDAKNKKFDIVIAKSVSRLGRNTVESLQTANHLEASNIRLILPEDSYDTTTCDSRLMFNLKAIFAEEESAKLSKRIKLGRQASAKQGKYQASLPLFGYKRDTTGELILDNEYAPIVKEIFHLYLHENWGWYSIANYLNEKKIPTPRTVSGARNAGHIWHESSIRVILKNISYTGTLVQHKEEVFNHMTKQRKSIPEKEQIFVGTIPAIISLDMYNAVQKKMMEKGKNKSNGQESIFAHIAVCADCGKGMRYRKDRGSYLCGGHIRFTNEFCTSHKISYITLLHKVKGDIKELITSNVKLDKLYESIIAETNMFQTNDKKELQQIEKRLRQLSKEFSDLFHLYTNKTISIGQFTTQNDKLKEEEQRLNERRITLEFNQEVKKDTERYFRSFKEKIAKFANLDVEDENVLKQLLHNIIQKIEVFEGGKIKIHYNFTTPINIPLNQGA